MQRFMGWAEQQSKSSQSLVKPNSRLNNGGSSQRLSQMRRSNLQGSEMIASHSRQNKSLSARASSSRWCLKRIKLKRTTMEEMPLLRCRQGQLATIRTRADSSSLSEATHRTQSQKRLTQSQSFLHMRQAKQAQIVLPKGALSIRHTRRLTKNSIQWTT